MNKHVTIVGSIALCVIIIATLRYCYFNEQPQKGIPLSVMIIGTNTEYPPFSFIENDKIVGFDIDVIREVAQRLGKSIVFKNMSFNGLIPEIQLGTIQVIAAGITPTPQRAQRVLFTKPHLISSENPLVLVSLASNPITNLQQASDKTIAVNQGYAADFYISTIDGITIKRLPSPLICEGLIVLNSGQADAFIASKNSIESLLAQEKENKFIVTQLPDTGESSAFAVSQKYPELKNQIDATLVLMHNDKTIENLKRKWKLI